MSYYLTQYQSANLGDAQIIENFVVRQKEFAKVMADIRTTDKKSSFQHYIFVGRRGSGKSTLLRRIQAEVNTDENLQKRFVVANLSEEQAGIYKLHDLWDYVIRSLSAQDYEIQNIDWQEYQDDLKAYSKALHQAILASLKKNKKQLIVCIDNIDRVLRNLGDEASLFREQLMNSNAVRIVGGSTIMAEDFLRYDLPFYQFFTIKRLEPLTLEEIQVLLEHWAGVRGIPDIANFIERHPGKIQAIRMLTDGTPRTMQMFVDMLIDRPNEQGFDYLRRIIDHATPVYQERLAQLSTQQQKIVLELSFFWEAASVEQLIPVCKMSGKNISAQMSQLVKARIVEKLKGQGKNMLYRLEERFFNLWLLMTQGGPKEKRSAKYLTKFLETWYDDMELGNVYDVFFQNLQTKAMAPDYVVAMTNSFAQSGRLSHVVRDAYLETAKSKQEIAGELSSELPETSQEKLDLFLSLREEGKLEEAIGVAETIEDPDQRLYLYIGECYFRIGNYAKAITEIEKGLLNFSGFRKTIALKPFEIEANFSIEKTGIERFVVSNALLQLYICYNNFGEKDVAIARLEDSINLGHAEGILILANYYYENNVQSEKALKLIAKFVLLNPENVSGLVARMSIQLWRGEMAEFANGIQQVFQKVMSAPDQVLELFFQELLIHKQYQLVAEFFIRMNVEKRLLPNTLPTYYAYLRLANVETPQLEAMPPELEEVVNDVVKQIIERRKVYYPVMS